MIRVFIDASVFFSACYSDRGASFEIFRLALRGKLHLVVSDFVLQETERNLTTKSPADVQRFQDFQENLSFEVINPSREEVLRAAEYTELKDAPIVAAAVKAEADYLASLDRRHLVDKKEVVLGSGLRIVLPQVVVQERRREPVEPGPAGQGDSHDQDSPEEIT